MARTGGTAHTVAAHEHVWQYDSGGRTSQEPSWQSYDQAINTQLRDAFEESGGLLHEVVMIGARSYVVLKNRKGWIQQRSDDAKLWRAVRHVAPSVIQHQVPSPTLQADEDTDDHDEHHEPMRASPVSNGLLNSLHASRVANRGSPGAAAPASPAGDAVSVDGDAAPAERKRRAADVKVRDPSEEEKDLLDAIDVAKSRGRGEHSGRATINGRTWTYRVVVTEKKNDVKVRACRPRLASPVLRMARVCSALLSSRTPLSLRVRWLVTLASSPARMNGLPTAEWCCPSRARAKKRAPFWAQLRCP
jgi:hypothetical protein